VAAFAQKIRAADRDALIMLEIKNVSHQFGGLLALGGVEMTVSRGRIVGLIGPNGAGKTTLINDISGLGHPTQGAIEFEGHHIEKAPPHRVARLGIARTYQNIRLFAEMTVLENLMVAQHRHGTSSILDSLLLLPGFFAERRRLQITAGELLERFELAPYAQIRAGAMPYGIQRRLEMARALATGPRLLLLDEPTAGMNPVETENLGEHILRLRADGLTILVIEHDMALIHQVCDEIYVLNFGQIIAHGTPDEVKHNPQVIEAYLGEDSEDGE
jgi:branched-chain amino acid transport system ATP-binding protein